LNSRLEHPAAACARFRALVFDLQVGSGGFLALISGECYQVLQISEFVWLISALAALRGLAKGAKSACQQSALHAANALKIHR
jgi:hypothetical protein